MKNQGKYEQLAFPYEFKSVEDKLQGSSLGKQGGWWVLELRGSNYNIGFQHGLYLACEIHQYLEDMKNLTYVSMGVTWDWVRKDVTRLLDDMKLIPSNNMEEIQGIVDGCNHRFQYAGFDNWSCDALDIIILNWYEGYTGYAYNNSAGREKKDRCSAFMAIGSYTKDGGIVSAHNSFNVFETSGHSWVLAHIVPIEGHEFSMETQVGYIHSMADDYCINRNSAVMDRILVTETTIGGFNKFRQGIPEFCRIRNAVQFCNSINDEFDDKSFVNIMRNGETGDYANTWLIGDCLHKKIYEFEEGLDYYTVNELTDGYFFGANYPKDPRIKHLECSNDGGNDLRRHQGARRVRLPQLCEKYKGEIDEEVARKIISDHYDPYLKKKIWNHGNSRTVCSHYNEDKREYMSDPSRPKPYQPRGVVGTVIMSSKLATDLSLYAHKGFSCGKPFNATKFFKKNPQFSELKPFVYDMEKQPYITFTPQK